MQENNHIISEEYDANEHGHWVYCPVENRDYIFHSPGNCVCGFELDWSNTKSA